MSLKSAAQSRSFETTRRRRNRQGEATRALLLESAITCLHEKGYAATSVDAVMSVAGVSRGSVLNQFPTRLDLMIAAAEGAMRAMMAHSAERLGEIDDPEARLRAMFDVAWEAQGKKEGTAMTEILLASRWDTDLAAGLRPIAEVIEQEIDRIALENGRAAGVSDLEDFRLQHRILILSLRGITIETSYDADREIMRHALESLRKSYNRHCDRQLGRIA